MLQERLIPLTENETNTKMCKLVKRLSETKEAFAVWGAGSTGKGMITYLQKESAGKLTPQCIVDNNPSTWGKDGVISPDEFFRIADYPPILLICVYVADCVIQQVQSSGYKGETIVCSTSLLFDTREAWQFYEDNMPALEATYVMLADDRSRETMEGFLNCIRSGNPTYLEKINGNSTDKMLDPTILNYTEEEVFADIGAFTGDTILQFLEFTSRKYKKIIGFELDPLNYDVLCQMTAREKISVILKNAAVGMTGQTVKFLSKSESSYVSENGDCEITMVALDDVPEMEDVTFIKVSTNGNELPVLQGAEKLIQRNTPKLAVYTGGHLLWKIPQYLKKIVPEYKIYLRHYGCGRQAMACYAVKG